MLNYDEILNRIQEVMKNNELTSSQFAERLGVQRSGISHILSGRNKPSLEFITKIHFKFDSVSIQWLLFGEENQKNKSNLLETDNNHNNIKFDSQFSEKKTEKIIILYDDKSFIEFYPKKKDD
ncbi:MAG: helix-turn-helix domain-containing protein [Flavobacteriaceae bacterium]|tara:strand:- start:172 stop:540 length:369 start_codon:yes stop_codon:yes gene_type:complete